MSLNLVVPKLANLKIDWLYHTKSQKYSGFAAGLGLDRFAMLKYHIADIRHLYTGDLRFINQFQEIPLL